MKPASMKSVKGGASSHIRPCKVSFCDKHNMRLDSHPSNRNIHSEFSKKNTVWVDPAVPNLVALDKRIRKDYFKYNGRKLPTSGPTKASPIKETVTIMPSGDPLTDEIQKRITDRIEKRFGVRCIRRYNHRDEFCKETRTFNWHGHEVWDFFDYRSHRIIQLNRRDMREWQDIVAEETGMPRGNPAEKTHRTWLTATEYKIQEIEKDYLKKQEALECVGEEVSQEFILKESLEKHNEALSLENQKLKAKNDEAQKRYEEKKKLAAEIDNQIKNEIQSILDKYLEPGYVLVDYRIISKRKESISPYGKVENYEDLSYVIVVNSPGGKPLEAEIKQDDYYRSNNKAIMAISRFFFGMPPFHKKVVTAYKKGKITLTK